MTRSHSEVISVVSYEGIILKKVASRHDEHCAFRSNVLPLLTASKLLIDVCYGSQTQHASVRILGPETYISWSSSSISGASYRKHDRSTSAKHIRDFRT
jgi:hypothetical protein